MINELDCIIVISDKDRFTMQNNFATSGAKVYNTLTEISKIDNSRYKTILIIGEYPTLENNISIIEIFTREFKNFKYYYLGEDQVWVNIMSKYARSELCQINIISNINMFDFINDNDMILDKSITPNMESVKLANKVLRESTDKDSKTLSMQFLKLYEELAKYKQKEEEQARIIASTTSNNNVILRELDEVYELHSQLYAESAELNNSITQYETINTANVYNKINVNNYINKPRIIYLKQYERLIYQNSFIETLFKVFRGHSHASVKVLVLYDNDGYDRSKYLKDYYRVLDNNHILESDIVTGDFLAKSGNYESLLDLILTNNYKLNYLIIVDCKNHDDAILSGNFMNYNLLTNLERIPKYGLYKDNTVVNGLAGNIPGYLTWPHFSNYNSVGDSDRILLTQKSSAITKIYSEVQEYYDRTSEVIE